MASRKPSVPPPAQPIGARTIEVDASWVIVTSEVNGVEKKEIKKAGSIPPGKPASSLPNKTIEVDESWLEERGFARIKKQRPPPLPPPVMLARPSSRVRPPPLPRDEEPDDKKSRLPANLR